MKVKRMLIACLICLLAFFLTSCITSKDLETEPTMEPEATTQQPERPVPLGIDPNLSEEQIDRIIKYWTFDEEWAMTMPCYNGYGDTWSVGLGQAHEFGLGIPYEWIGSRTEPAQDLVAYSFYDVDYWYYDGLIVVGFSGFYGDKPGEMQYRIKQYISTTQPDCKTPRGISPGDSIARLKEVYPEVEEHKDYWTENNPLSGISEHDNCFMYLPEGTHRSILFLTKGDVIVQIDMADGLDGQYTFPAWTGVPNVNTP